MSTKLQVCVEISVTDDGESCAECFWKVLDETRLAYQCYLFNEQLSVEKRCKKCKQAQSAVIANRFLPLEETEYGYGTCLSKGDRDLNQDLTVADFGEKREE